MADWHPGQEIICVNTEWVNPLASFVTPIKGRIYTIDHIIDDGDKHGPAFHLQEIHSIQCWFAFHFRPLKKVETDISTFISLLTPTKKKKVLEDA